MPHVSNASYQKSASRSKYNNNQADNGYATVLPSSNIGQNLTPRSNGSGHLQQPQQTFVVTHQHCTQPAVTQASHYQTVKSQQQLCVDPYGFGQQHQQPLQSTYTRHHVNHVHHQHQQQASPSLNHSNEYG